MPPLFAEMSDAATVWVSVIGAVVAITTLAGSAFGAWMAFRMAQLNLALRASTDKVNHLETTTNGLKTELVAAVKAGASAQGGMDERARADLRNLAKAQAPVPVPVTVAPVPVPVVVEQITDTAAEQIKAAIVPAAVEQIKAAINGAPPNCDPKGPTS